MPGDSALASGGRRAQGQSNRVDQERGGQTEVEASAPLVAEEVPDRLAGDDRGTWIPASEVLPIDIVLHPDRLVEPQSLPIDLTDLRDVSRTEYAAVRSPGAM